MKLPYSLIPILLACTSFAHAFDGSKLAGTWAGSGRFYNAKLRTESGPLRFVLHFQPDLTVSGTVGGATLQPCKPRRTGDKVEFEVALRGEISPDKNLHKTYLVLLITQLDGEKLSGDFHLKSNLIFDLNMRPGELQATRTK